jgi:hypothetical protein
VSTHPFEKEFDRVIDAFDRSHAAAKRKFVEVAGVRPADAIRHCGEAVVREERALSALRYARKFVAREGSEHQAHVAALLCVTSELRSSVLFEAAGSGTTGEFANGVDRAELRGLVAAVRALETLIRHESVAVG